MSLRGGFWRLVIIVSIAILAASALTQEKKADQDLRITFGGFVGDHPEGGKLEGICGPDDTRSALDCDIYNGLVDWTVTEIVLAVVWSPYEDENKRYVRVSVSIEPLKTERVSVRLGLQLPPDTVLGARPMKHWGWQIMGARGYRYLAK